MLRTRDKILLARALRFPIVLFSRIRHKGTLQTVTRRGIKWSLDLDQGIDLSIYVFGCFEPKTTRALQELIAPGDIVIDIGANIGAHTLGMARLVGATGRVIAFEPTRFAHAKLLRNLELNTSLAVRVTVEQIFLTDRPTSPAPGTVYSSWPLNRTNELHAKHRGAAEDTTGASAKTLDDYVLTHSIERVGLIKLDVDGHECQVLRGADQVLKSHRPIILMELAPYTLCEAGDSVEELLRILAEAGYSLLYETSRRSLPSEAHQVKTMIEDGASINVVAKPRRC